MTLLHGRNFPGAPSTPTELTWITPAELAWTNISDKLGHKLMRANSLAFYFVQRAKRTSQRRVGQLAA